MTWAPHALYLSDARRVRAYAEAVRRTVRAGDRVVDLGTGTGILALMAIRAGASHVTAIERGRVVRLARAIARENGVNGQVTFVRADSRRVRTPTRADVLITETMGNLGVGEGMLEATVDARRRLLRPGARIVPAELRIWFQPMSAPRPPSVPGLRIGAVRELLRHRPMPMESGAGRAIGAARPLLRFRVGRDAFPAEGRATFAVRGVLRGFAAWFEARLAPGVSLVSRTGTHWRRIFFPVEPIRVRRAELTVRFTGDREFHWSVAGGSSHSSWLGELR